VSNCSITAGRGIAVVIENSANIELSDNNIADFVQQGIWVQTSSRVTIDRNWLHHVQPATDAPAMRAYPI
jgi:parallel beta-helix repeat protein